MRLNWHLSLILASILCPTATFAQTLPQPETAPLKADLTSEIVPLDSTSFEISKSSYNHTTEIIPEEIPHIAELQPPESKHESLNIDKKQPEPTKAEAVTPLLTETTPEVVNTDKKQPEHKKPAPVTSPSTETETEATQTTTPETANSCESAPPLAQHPFATPIEVAQKETQTPLPTQGASALEKPPTADPETTSEATNAPSPEDIARYQTLAKGDHFYRCGDTLLAERFYRDAKEPFGKEAELNREMLAQAVYEPEQLLPGGGVYWRLYQESLTDNQVYKSKRLAPLQLLSAKYPEFIPGHLKYAEALEQDKRPDEAREILTTAATLYPNEAPLVDAKIAADEEAKNWLAASLTARQFAIFNQDHFRAAEFKKRADDNLARYQGDLQSQMAWNMVGNAVMGGVGAALMGNVFAPLSTLQTSYLLLQGESAIGQSYAEGMKNQLKLVDDPEVLAYVNEIGQKLAKAAGREEFNYEFYVVMDENINAFALPGGKIFVNAGAIAKTDSEAELAGLLAHELAHTVLSHGFQQMTQSALTSSVVDYIPYVGGLANSLAVLSYSREMEQQADLFGTRLLAATGYAADGVRNLMVVMNDEHKNRPPAWLSTHPDTSDRVKYIEVEIVRNNFNRFAYEGVEKHQQMRQEVDEILATYKAEKEGKKPEDKKDKKEKPPEQTAN
ncbi:M48 family metallopeptidase [Crocosphaera sp. XPORK-15E]|uniref:M48 family metallopeptidase n=1 Tax=Crocosphaera sp. XPORK-15E TaxID=3110247 RepID=UPI002B1E9D01|nr:M48 family metalloprotease [Crocosphaera sp. XPORK-15E]MEA5537162.1 M48 family metalloprotease [Crocosphaera sp. XPORK-15E]